MDTPKIRIIPKLEIKSSNVIKGIRMEGLRVVGKPELLSEKYYLEGADEIIFIDTVASLYGRNHLIDLVTKTAENIKLPLCVGGGIRSLDDAKTLLRNGADKISINTGICNNSKLITNLAHAFGSQSVVASIQAKKLKDSWEVYCNNGREKTGKDVCSWIVEVIERGAGEILLTSIDQDGTKLGPDFELIENIKNKVSVPLIVSGGIRNVDDIIQLANMGVYAIAIANILHFDFTNIDEIKLQLKNMNIKTRIARNN